MSARLNRQAGFTAFEVIIIAVLAILIILAGWWVYSQTQKEEEPQEETTTQMTVEEDAAPTIEQPEDLQGAEDYLQELNIDGNLDTTDIDETLR